MGNSICAPAINMEGVRLRDIREIIIEVCRSRGTKSVRMRRRLYGRKVGESGGDDSDEDVEDWPQMRDVELQRIRAREPRIDLSGIVQGCLLDGSHWVQKAKETSSEAED